MFDEVQQVRAANRTSRSVGSVPRTKQRYALSGLATCGYCGGHLNFQRDSSGKGRMVCYRRSQSSTGSCRQRSCFADVVEAQLGAYLRSFHIDDDMLARVVAMGERARDDHDDTERRRREITNRLERIAELYKWGDMTREAYQAERDHLEAELSTLRNAGQTSDLLARAATFLRELPSAWDRATAEQCNTLAAIVFESIEIKDDRVVAVVVKEDFRPFFAAFGQQETPAGEPGCQVGPETLEGAEATGLGCA